MKAYTKKELNEIFSDKEFVTKLAGAASDAEFQAAMLEKGMEATAEEAAAIRTMLSKVNAGEITKEQLEDGELPEELLDQVSGGLGLIAAILIVVGGWGAMAGIPLAISAATDDDT